MLVYHVYTATLRSGGRATCLISEDALEDTKPEDFFLPGAQDITDHGTVEISGPEEHMLTECLSDK